MLVEDCKSYIKYIQVALPLALDKLFTYQVKQQNSNLDLIGCRVVVRFNNRKITGFVVATAETTDLKKVLTVEEILDREPLFSVEFLNFCRWIAEYYMASLGEVLKLALPSSMLKKSNKQIGLNHEFKLDDYSHWSDETLSLYYELQEKGTILLSDLKKGKADKKGLLKELEKMKRVGAVQVESIVDDFTVKEKTFVFIKKKYKLSHIMRTLLPKEMVLIKFLSFLEKQGDTVSQKELKEKYGFSDYIIKKSVDKGYCEKVRLEHERRAEELLEDIGSSADFDLTDEQTKAVDEVSRFIKMDKFGTFLLHGVTGSGKTAVYIEILKKVREKNKTSIVLIPEIALTPQTVKRFRWAFGDEIAVLHSRLSEGERFDSWRKIKEGRYSIVIGPRSALFAPLQNIGALIVDEEHEGTYKQTDSAPRYNARSCAVIRGMMNQAVVVLGSATPSLESYYNALSGKYHLLELKNRIPGASIPVTRLVKFSDFHYGHIFGAEVVQRVREELEKDRQVIVFQNRRGYSSYLRCRSCGEVRTCPNCSVSLTYHLQKKELVCHYCGYFEKAKDYCGNCGSSNVYFKGTGTEKVEENLHELFPETGIVRMDQDTTRKKGSHGKLLKKFEDKEASVLVGTQMVAKGLDFPEVTMVCIVNVDTELIFPDYRSDERAFQLITQVAGRAGRGEHRGEVLIQTFDPDHKVLKYAVNHDYKGFYEYEIKNRELIAYPPFVRIVKIMFLSHRYEEIKQASDKFYLMLKQESSKLQVYHPVDSMISKVNKIYRMNLIVKTAVVDDKNGSILRSSIKKVMANLKFKGSTGFKIKVDVDPVSLM